MSTPYTLMDPDHLLAVAHIEARTPLEVALVARLEADDESQVREWIELADEGLTDAEEIRELIEAMPYTVENATELLKLCSANIGFDVDKLRWMFEEYADCKLLLQQHGMEDVQQLRELLDTLTEVEHA